MPNQEQIIQALATVDEPTIGAPITELGMVDAVQIDGRDVTVTLRLPLPGGAGQDVLAEELKHALAGIPGAGRLGLKLVAMPEEERKALARRLRLERGQVEDSEVVFAKAGSRTKVICVASGKGGVGKSSVTVNLAAALAADGHEVGVLDADIYGYSVPRMLGVSGQPVGLAGLVMPLRAHGCKVISIGFFLPDPDRPVLWRGPMLHRALQQFLADVWWGELDFLLCDLPPGTGDVAISLGQMLPNAELVVVTTPQQAAQKVARRAGQMAADTGMKVGGVIENMATFTCPDCGSSHDIFGKGGGAELAAELDTELLGRIPIDPRLREGGDAGTPLVMSHPDVPAAQALRSVAEEFSRRTRSVVGKQLPLMAR